MWLLLLQHKNHAILVVTVLVPQDLDSDPGYSLAADTQASEE